MDFLYVDPPSTTLRATGFVLSLILSPNRVACNNTQKHPSKNTQADLRNARQGRMFNVSPQGKIKMA